MTHRFILGVKVDDITREEALERISRLLRTTDSHAVIATVGPEFILTAQTDPEFKKIINDSFLSLPDGFGLRLAGIKNRLPGVDLMLDICGIAHKNNWSIGLLGARETIAQKTAMILKEKFPGLKISFDLDGQNADTAVSTNKIPNTDILFVAYGHPRQEKIISQLLKIENCKLKIGVGVGGSFDLISGQIKRAPKIFQSLGLEWLWRFFQEPKRLFPKIFRATIIFPIKLFSNNIKDILTYH